MKTLIAALAGVLSLGAAAAHAGVIDARQVRQDWRIDQGVRSGSLTPAETRVLRVEQGRIARTRDRALADGAMSVRERTRITREQNQASRDIHRLKHNALGL
jgi:hypothetical protein